MLRSVVFSLLNGVLDHLQSVYLQQVGILVFMAHIGCFVPAAYAEIGMVDRIIARTNQDGELMESFAADLVSPLPKSECSVPDYAAPGSSLCDWRSKPTGTHEQYLSPDNREVIGSH